MVGGKTFCFGRFAGRRVKPVSALHAGVVFDVDGSVRSRVLKHGVSPVRRSNRSQHCDGRCFRMYSGVHCEFIVVSIILAIRFGFRAVADSVDYLGGCEVQYRSAGFEYRGLVECISDAPMLLGCGLRRQGVRSSVIGVVVCVDRLSQSYSTHV